MSAKAYSGFTLVDSLLTVAVISVLITLVIPLGSSLRERSRFTQELTHAFQSLTHARELALATGQSITASVTTGPEWCIGLTASNSCDCRATDCLVRSREHTARSMYPSVSVTATSFVNNRQISFSGYNGTAFGSAGTLTLTSSHHQAKIIVSAIGRVRQCVVTGYLPGVEPC